jgi:hypothetical protein
VTSCPLRDTSLPVDASSDAPLRGSLALPPPPAAPPPKSDLKKDCIATAGVALATPRLRDRAAAATGARAAAVRAARRDAARASGACGTRADMRSSDGRQEEESCCCAVWQRSLAHARVALSARIAPEYLPTNSALPSLAVLALRHGARHAAGAGAAHARRPVVRGG